MSCKIIASRFEEQIPLEAYSWKTALQK